ncbi:hypothetical protein BST81_00800 [Leptolyngbya sp. 'hensonii']|uniref:type I polyketide synthase n=1 Tax=Leptolyngbya sp. 'hensonii' TaxID=1922337 RepID=UPI00094FE3AC|nr:type I polyketide synthase [Leptolyngbya sp. 'hensonii']OLP20309.1 hypothetical protein BST81_00800 [Leptolyngbya sp. 'hensonii']
MSAPDNSTLSPLKQAYLALERMQAKLAALTQAQREPIAVIGLSCRFPGAANPAAFWQLLEEGVDAIREVPPDRWDIDAYYDPDPDAPGKIATRWGGFLDQIADFDPQLFDISPREALTMDPQQRLLLEVAWEALEDAGYAPDRLVGSATGVFIGIVGNDYAQLQLADNGITQIDTYYGSGTGHSVASGRISYVLGLQGPSLSIDTACSSSLVAIHQAVQSLRSGECRMALAGGVNAILTPEVSIALSRFHMMAPDGRCKTFDDRADGFVRGEGCGLVVLKRLSDAVADGDRILAVVRGSAVNQDGASSGLTAPNGPAQEALIRAALANADLSPAAVSYVETHGTGTSLGDPIEVQALGAVLREGRPADQPVAIGSVKTNVGHLEAAAGVAGFIKLVLALHHGRIPPHLHLQQPNRLIAWEQLPVVIPTQLTDWTVPERIAGVSSFGFSGTNAHLILAEAPQTDSGRPQAGTDRPLHLLTLAGKTPEALRELAERYRTELVDRSHKLADICFTANTGRATLPCRLGLWASNSMEVCDSLAAFLADREPEHWVQGQVEQVNAPQIVFLFTGQGAQYVGMGQELYQTQPTFRSALDRCDALLRPYLERPLLEVLHRETGLLDQTAYTQPALFAISYALGELWKSWGISPSVVLGHSVGEYAAACAAGVFSLEDGLKLIAARGRLMQSLPEGGAMAVVFADQGTVMTALQPYGGAVTIAAINGPQNIVISGEAVSVQAVLQDLTAQEIKTHPLTVSHAFHSPLIEPILAEFEQVAATVTYGPPRMRFISAATGTIVKAETLSQPGYWRQQTRNPVQFAAAVQALQVQENTLVLEMGPHPVLIGMARQSLPDSLGGWLPSLRRGMGDWEQLLESLATFYVRGGSVDWAGFDRDYARQKLSLPTYPFQRQRYWVPVRRPAPVPSSPGSHPLLGQRLRSALKAIQFEAHLQVTALPFLQDHRVHGLAILPATAYVEVALAAAITTLGHGSPTLSDLVIHEALAVPDAGGCALQTIVTVGPGPQASFQIFSLEDSPEVDPDAWKLQASGTLQRSAPIAPEGSSLVPATLQARCPDLISAQTHYQQLAERGLVFGPSLQGVVQIWRRDGEAIGQIQAPDCLMGELGAYHIHPALLDACVQVLAAAVPTDIAATDLYLPVGLDRCQTYGKFPPRLWSHVQLQLPPGQSAPATLTAQIQIFDQAGTLLAELVGLRLRKASRTALFQATGPDVNQWLYQVTWEPQPSSMAIATHLTSPATIAAQVCPQVPELDARYGLDRYREFSLQVGRLSNDYILLAWQQLGWQPQVGQSWTIETLAVALGVPDSYHRLLGRSLAMLQAEGWVQPVGSAWTVLRAPKALTAPVLAQRLQALTTHYPEFEIELTLVGRCGPHLAGVFKGTIDPLTLLFPGGDLSVAARLYQESPAARAYNHLVQESVTAALAQFPADRPLRVLEIGGGTGGTTAHVLPLFTADRTHYTFTDISPLFTAKAAEKFSAYPFVHYQPLDIEQDPIGQGFPAHQCDLILAANVIHATADLGQTLDHVQQLLAPGGLFLMLEMTRPDPWIDITFGLTEGWWKFVDTDVRPTYPLLSPTEWLTLLTRQGFETAATVPALESQEMTEETVILAQAPQESLRSEQWLILTDRQGIGIQLAELLQAQHHACVLATTAPLDNPPDGIPCIVVDPTRPEAFQGLLQQAPQWHQIVHLWSTDLPSLGDRAAADWETSQALACGTVLHLAQAIAQLPQAVPPRLWLVTRGGQAVGAEPQAVAVPQSTLWGLGKTIALEYPEWHCTRIDLDPNPAEPAAPVLFRELAAGSPEDQVGFRRGQRYVARLARLEADRTTPEPEAVQVQVPERGLLDQMTFRPLERRAPGPGEVEIRVRATGLNFKDVLNVLGLYPGDPGPLGSECTGEIVAVGEGVTDLQVGDGVMAVAPGCFQSFITTRADFVLRKPDALSFEAAATIPIPFLTAAFTLQHLAKIAPGDRVLIHAAAGGVGLAAVQIAQQLGAEVFATAGSPEKRAFLQATGVPHVLNSRTLDFADEILALTDGRGVDIVLNSLADEFIPKSFAVLAPQGRFVEIGKRGILDPAAVATMRPDVSYFIVDWGETSKEDPALIRRLFLEIGAAIGAGQFQPLPQQVFPLSEIVSAFRYMAAAKHIGKIVITHPIRTEQAPVAIRPDATYLITGGLGGLGLKVAQWLVERGAQHLVLVGRRPPTPAAQATIASLTAAGAQVVVAQADVAVADQMALILADLEASLPPLRGIIHGAGTLDDGVLLQQNWPRFAGVMAPKVAGAWHLHQLTQGKSLDFFVLFSSIASLFGSAGQGNHAAANAWLDQLAQYRRSLGLPGLSINWGVWSEVGAAAQQDVVQRASSQGIGAIAPDQGIRVLETLLAGSPAQVGVTPMNWSRFLGQFTTPPLFLTGITVEKSAAPEVSPMAVAPTQLWQQLQGAAPQKQGELLARHVETQIRKVLGIDPAQVISDRKPLSELGLDSLMAIELKNLLGKGLQLSCTLPATLVFDYPTGKDLTDYLCQQVRAELPSSGTEGQPEAEEKTSGESLLHSLDELEDLSDDEVDRLIAQYKKQ